MNELYAKFRDKGLSVLGVTGETPGQTAPFIRDNEALYPYAFDPDLATMRWFNQSGFPSAVLIDADGRVAWKGHPASLKEATIEKAIAGALLQPVFEVEGWSAIRELLDEERYAEAYAKVDATEGDAVRDRLRNGVDRILGRRMLDLKELWDAGEYLAVSESCDRLEKQISGLPELGQVLSYGAEMKKTRDIRDILAAQEKVRDMIPQGRLKSAQKQKLIKDLNKLAERFPGTVVERDVREAIARISGY